MTKPRLSDKVTASKRPMPKGAHRRTKAAPTLKAANTQPANSTKSVNRCTTVISVTRKMRTDNFVRCDDEVNGFVGVGHPFRQIVGKLQGMDDGGEKGVVFEPAAFAQPLQFWVAQAPMRTEAMPLPVHDDAAQNDQINRCR